jgi:hypothetical protein
MKTLKYFVFISFAAQLLYSQSSIVIGAGASIDVGLGADICADIITGTVTGDGTQCGSPLLKVLNLTALLEGFYDGATMVPDTVRLQFRGTSSPYTLIEEKPIFLNSSGSGTGSFTSVMNGTSYYLVVRHRNALETWSKTGKSFISNSLNYDFTTSSSQAYGDNMKLKGSKWTIYSGDVTQDGLVDLSDEIAVINDILSFVSGTALSTDVNGDGLVDLSDIIIVVNNTLGFVAKQSPEVLAKSVKILQKYDSIDQ